MSIYQTHVLPRLLNAVLGSRQYDAERKWVASQANGTVLEIGFGSGTNVPFYKNITKLYALEPSKELWNLAQERVGQAQFPIEYIQASAEKMPLADNSFDTVVSTWSLCSIPNPNQALQEVKRVLKPNGKFVFVEHGLSSNEQAATWQNRLTPIWKRCAGGCHLNRDVSVLLTQAGFQMNELQKSPKGSGFSLLHYFYKGIGQKSA